MTAPVPVYASSTERIRDNLHLIANNVIRDELPKTVDEVFEHLAPKLFKTLDAFPAARPWQEPVPVANAVLPPPWYPGLQLNGDADGLLRERYDVIRCPDLSLLECAEVWATGQLSAAKRLACVGLRVEYINFHVTELARKPFKRCPLHRKSTNEQQLRAKDQALLQEKRDEWARNFIALDTQPSEQLPATRPFKK